MTEHTDIHCHDLKSVSILLYISKILISLNILPYILLQSKMLIPLPFMFFNDNYTWLAICMT